MRILDPACGSGSFLIGAYQYLLDWHLKYYTENNPDKHAKGRNPKIYQASSRRSEPDSSRHSERSRGIYSTTVIPAQAGIHSHCEERSDEAISNYKLTIAEKKRILLNNIFGVDIDSQTVEVTKLSLLLKVLEGEDAQTLENQYRLFHERALPDLANNIKCGNSLIGHDFFDDYQRLAPAPVAGGSHETTIPDDLYQKINPFDWHSEFPKIFKSKNPGFDTIIGNPPWIQSKFMDAIEKRYYEEIFFSMKKQFDIFNGFVEKGATLLKQIDKLVYQLYGLTEEEIEIVEQNQ